MNVAHCVQLHTPLSWCIIRSVFDSFLGFVLPKSWHIFFYLMKQCIGWHIILQIAVLPYLQELQSQTTDICKDSLLRKKLRKYDAYAQYPRSALVLRVLSKKRCPSTAAGKVVSQCLDYLVWCWHALVQSVLAGSRFYGLNDYSNGMARIVMIDEASWINISQAIHFKYVEHAFDLSI